MKHMGSRGRSARTVSKLSLGCTFTSASLITALCIDGSRSLAGKGFWRRRTPQAAERRGHVLHHKSHVPDRKNRGVGMWLIVKNGLPYVVDRKSAQRRARAARVNL